MTTSNGAYITQVTVDQVWVSGKIWTVVGTQGEELHHSPVFRKLGCRIWALTHGYGWLPVK